MWTLTGNNSVVPGVNFLTPPPAYCCKSDGSLGHGFPQCSRIVKERISQAYHHDVYIGVLFRLSSTLVAFDILSKAWHPTQKAQPTLSNYLVLIRTPSRGRYNTIVSPPPGRDGSPTPVYALHVRATVNAGLPSISQGLLFNCLLAELFAGLLVRGGVC